MTTSVPDSRPSVVFLIDVDNTLLDNDRVAGDLRGHLERGVGVDCSEYYFEIYEELRQELGYADYLGALQRYRVARPHDPRLLAISSYLINYPFADRLYPGALEVLRHLSAFGQTVILSDGDVVFQPRKVERSGLADATEGRVLIYIHKERELEDIERRFPARHYVLIDDKVRILAAVKNVWGEHLTTVFPRQGHYAHDSNIGNYRSPDMAIDRIAELLDYDSSALILAASEGPA